MTQVGRRTLSDTKPADQGGKMVESDIKDAGAAIALAEQQWSLRAGARFGCGNSIFSLCTQTALVIPLYASYNSQLREDQQEQRAVAKLRTQ